MRSSFDIFIKKRSYEVDEKNKKFSISRLLLFNEIMN